MPALELSEVVTRQIEQWINDHVYTAIPAKVIGVDNYTSKQVIDIQPQINHVFTRNNKNVEMPPVLDVPVVWPSAGGGLLSFPINVGDTVFIVFAEKSIDEWLESKGDQTSYTPADSRTYSLADAIALPGLYPMANSLNPSATDVELKFKESYITLGADNSIVIKNANGSFTISEDGTITLANGGSTLTLETSGAVTHGSGAQITSLGDFVTASGVSLDNHDHNYINPNTPSPVQPGITDPPNT